MLINQFARCLCLSVPHTTPRPNDVSKITSRNNQDQKLANTLSTGTGNRPKLTIVQAGEAEYCSK